MSVLTLHPRGHAQGQTRLVSIRAMGRQRGGGGARGAGGAGGKGRAAEGGAGGKGSAAGVSQAIAGAGVPGRPRKATLENAQAAPRAREHTHGRSGDWSDEEAPVSGGEPADRRAGAPRETAAAKRARIKQAANDQARQEYCNALDSLQPDVPDPAHDGYLASMQRLARALAEQFVWTGTMYGTDTHFRQDVHTDARSVGLFRVQNAHLSVQYLLRGPNIHHCVPVQVDGGPTTYRRVGPSYDTASGAQPEFAPWVSGALRMAMQSEGWHRFRSKLLSSSKFNSKEDGLVFGTGVDREKRSAWHVYMAGALADCDALGKVCVVSVHLPYTSQCACPTRITTL
jgi:hypothetical protein